MQTKFTLSADQDKGKSLTLRVLGYLLMEKHRQKIVKAFVFHRYNKEMYTHVYFQPDIPTFIDLFSNMDNRVVLELEISNRTVFLITCSSGDIAEEVRKNWYVYDFITKMFPEEKNDILFISTCHPHGDSREEEDRQLKQHGFVIPENNITIEPFSGSITHTLECRFKKETKTCKFKKNGIVEGDSIGDYLQIIPDDAFLKKTKSNVTDGVKEISVCRALQLRQYIQQVLNEIK